jgi:ammonium transporter, Amt family
VTSSPVPSSPEITTVVCVIFILLVPLAGAGLSLINTGLGRSRSAAHAMLSSLCVIGVAAAVYFVCGFAWQGFIGGPEHVTMVGGTGWSWIAAERLFLRGPWSGGSAGLLAACLGMFSVSLAALIPLGSGSDRWRLGAACASTALLAGWTFPLFAHWVWGGGWLAQLGVNYGLGHGFLDAGGSGTIQTVGGLTALSIAWILGPRRGKYSAEGMPAAIPGHNAIFVLFGCLLALVGWLGLNCAGAILFTGAELGRAALVAINTVLGAGSGALAAAMTTRTRFGRPDVSLTANGWISGLVATSASCAFVGPAAAVLIGAVAGVLVAISVEWFELHLAVDDPGGAISVHAVSGIWGLLALGVFARFSGPVANVPAALSLAGSGNSGQFLAQLVGVATLLGFVFPLTYGLNWLLDRLWPQRVAPEGERQGLDLHELGAGAYPEFVTHTEEFTQQ